MVHGGGECKTSLHQARRNTLDTGRVKCAFSSRPFFFFFWSFINFFRIFTCKWIKWSVRLHTWSNENARLSVVLKMLAVQERVRGKEAVSDVDSGRVLQPRRIPKIHVTYTTSERIFFLPTIRFEVSFFFSIYNLSLSKIKNYRPPRTSIFAYFN